MASSDASEVEHVDLRMEPAIGPLFLEGLADDVTFESGPLAGFKVTSSPRGVHFSRDGLFLSADPSSRRLVADRPVASLWETFYPTSKEKLEAYLGFNRSPSEEIARFGRAVADLIARNQPVKIQCGCGHSPRPDFLNLDHIAMEPNFSVTNPDRYFIFPFTDTSWGIPDNCIDYIYHEDFIEHISQLQQIQFLAETLRVLKPNCYHRVNTPDIIAAMKRHSKFAEGFGGVYTGELQYDHIALFSHASLKEMAQLVGYREVIFTTKGHGVSPYAVADSRPWADRDPITGNIYADLQK